MKSDQSPTPLPNAVAILDFNDFERVTPINEVGIRLTVLCEKKGTGEKFYVKETYSDEWSRSEVVGAMVLSLTGMCYPENYLVVNTERHPFFSAHHEKLRQEGEETGKVLHIPHRLAVASAAIPGYQDAGEYAHAVAEKNDCMSKASPATITEGIKESFEVLVSNFQQLPKQERNMLLQLFPAAQWVADWDFWNIKGENAGYAVRTPPFKGQKAEMVPAGVDLGNVFHAGFKGNVKEKSFGYVNQPAKVGEPLIPDELKVEEWAAGFGVSGAMRLLSVIPKRYTMAAFFPRLEKDIIKTLSDAAGVMLPDEYVKGLYRISLIPEAAIRAVLSPASLARKGVEWSEDYATELADILVENRDLLADKRGPVGQAIRSWACRNRVEALSIEREVASAVRRITGISGRGMEI